MDQAPGLDPIVRNLQWTILGNASESSFDPNGRMLLLLPLELREYAEIKKAEKVSLIGMGNKFEVWNENNWEMRQTGLPHFPIILIPDFKFIPHTY